MMKTLIGIDVGTSGCKCTMFDFDGKVLATASREYSVIQTGKDRYELDSNVVFSRVIEILAEIASKAPQAGPSYIAVSSFGETATPVDKDGHVLHNAIMFNDGRGVKQAGRIEAILGQEQVVQHAGVSVHPTYTICKTLWFKENMPEVYEKTWKMLLYEDFINFKLTGKAVIDYSLASRTMAFDVSRKQWWDEAITDIGLRRGIFSDAVPSGTAIGKIKPAVARETGMHPDTVVVAGGHDQACAGLGSGAVADGMVVLGIGSSECITSIYGRPVLSDMLAKFHYNSSPYVVDGYYYSIAYNFTGASLLRWYKNNFSEKQLEDAQKMGVGIYEYLDKRVGKKPTDLLVLPHFSGSGNPTFDVDAKSAVIGMTFSTTHLDVYKALMEGTTYEMRLNLECLKEMGIRQKDIVAVGGGAKSDVWLQIKSNIFNMNIRTLKISEAGTLGTVILAGQAAGLYASAADGVTHLVKKDKVFCPDCEQARCYERQYQKYRKLYGALKTVFES